MDFRDVFVELPSGEIYAKGRSLLLPASTQISLILSGGRTDSSASL